MINLYYGTDKLEFQSHELEQFKELIDVLKEEYYENQETLHIFADYIIGQFQIDLIIIKKNAVLIIDMKSYEGEIHGNENGKWYVKKDGKKIPINQDDNPFRQIKKHKYTLQKFLNKYLFNNIPRFKKTNGIHNISSWLYFLDNSCYAKSAKNQINFKINKWFRVVNPSNIVSEINLLDSQEFIFSKPEIEKIVTLFNGIQIDIDTLKPREIIKKGSEEKKKIGSSDSEIDRLWAKIDSLDFWEDAKNVYQSFQKFFNETKEKKSISIIKHGMALTAKTYSESIEILLDIFESDYEYEGYENHNFYVDLFEAYWSLDDGKVPELLNNVIEYLVKNDKIDILYDLFCDMSLSGSNDGTGLLDDVGKELIKKHPDDYELLAAYVQCTIDIDNSESWEHYKKLMYNSKNPGDYIHYIDFFMDFAGTDDFFNILKKVRKSPELEYCIYDELLLTHYLEKIDEIKDVGEIHKIEIEIEKILKQLHGAFPNNTFYLKRLIIFYKNKKNLEKTENYCNKLLTIGTIDVDTYYFIAGNLLELYNKNEIESIIKILDILYLGFQRHTKNEKIMKDLMKFEEDLSENDPDYSKIIEILQSSLEKDSSNTILHARLADIYRKLSLRRLAIKHYENVFINPGTPIKDKEEQMGRMIRIISPGIRGPGGLRYRKEKEESRNEDKVPDMINKRNKIEKKLVEYEIDALESLFDLYLKNNQISKAHQLCERLKEIPIINCEDYCKPIYKEYSKYLNKL